VANFSVANNPRTFDRQTNEWKDGEPLFLRCNSWAQAAENVAESLSKGLRVIVVGRLKQRTFQTREGQKVTVVEIDVDEIGPSLRWATATIVKVTRTNGGSAAPSGEDAWGSAGELVGAGTAGGDRPPF
jgi:single-strand DNA-binding protein